MYATRRPSPKFDNVPKLKTGRLTNPVSGHFCHSGITDLEGGHEDGATLNELNQQSKDLQPLDGKTQKFLAH